jgi:hypothetical protein
MNVWVQTIICRECKQLYDAVTRMKVVDPLTPLRLQPWRPLGSHLSRARPSAFSQVLQRLPTPATSRWRWIAYKIQCPVSAIHKVEVWNDPGRCPRCALHIEKNVLPFRVWD